MPTRQTKFRPYPPIRCRQGDGGEGVGVEVRVLGPVEVSVAGRPLPLGGTKQRAVLAVLALQADRVVSVDRLVDALWGQAPPDSAVNAVQVYVSRLRKTLHTDQPDSPAAILRRRSPGYVLELDEADRLDLHRFERLAGEGVRAVGAAPERAAAILREALDLWRGRPLAEFADEPFAPPEMSRLEEKRLTTLEARIEADLGVGRHAELVGELQGLVGQHPLREGLQHRLMLSLYRSGRQAEALAAYRRTREILAEELGVDPCPALQELEGAILAQDRRLDWIAPLGSPGPMPPSVPRPNSAGPMPPADADDPDDVAATRERLRATWHRRNRPEHDLPSGLIAGGKKAAGPSELSHAPPPTAPVSLPAAVNELIGRDRELVETAELLARTRALTVTGPGGSGKTSLTIELARRVSERYAEGAWLVELAALTDPKLVVQQVASTLGLDLPPERDPESALILQVADRDLLIVLDNCEHLVDACAGLVTALLRGCPRVIVLATSREPLRVAGEVTWRIPSLALPDPAALPPPAELADIAAVRLFVERATRGSRVSPGHGERGPSGRRLLSTRRDAVGARTGCGVRVHTYPAADRAPARRRARPTAAG